MVTAFYATQHIFHKAYGNYLGLAELGAFVARETALQLIRVTCVAANACRGDKSRTTEARELATQALSGPLVSMGDLTSRSDAAGT
jgi:hypothetical protein